MNTKQNRIYLSSPHMSGDEQKYINQAFEQNWIAPLGPNVNELENTLAKYSGVKHASALSSGTAALHLSLILLGVKAGDEIMVSTFTFSASVNPIVYQGASPVFIDSERETWNMDPELLEKALSERIANGTIDKVKAIILVHLYGMPSKMDEILNIAGTYNIPIIEDAAEALGSKYKDQPIGSFGMMSILSFNGNKIITTSGGGALLSNDEQLIEKSRFLATQARDAAPHYQHSQIGYNYRMSNVLAGIGRGQMEVIDDRVEQRRANYDFYKSIFKNVEGVSLLEEPEGMYSNRWLSAILIDFKRFQLSIPDFQAALEEDNIECRPLWKPMHMQPIFSKYECYINGTSEELFNMGICLPSGSNMSDDDRQRILDSICKLLNIGH